MMVAFPVSHSIKTHHRLFSTKPLASDSYSDTPSICLLACHGNRFPHAELISARLYTVRPEHRQQTQSSTQRGQELYVNHHLHVILYPEDGRENC